MVAIVTRGDAADLHLPDETVDLIVTSPPYFGLRSYTDGGEHYAGHVGGSTGLAATFKRSNSSHTLVPGQSAKQQRDDRPDVPAANPLGKLPGSVWSIPTAPLTVPAHLGVDHFAAYPPELVRRIVLGWSPREVCTVCGEGRRPVGDRDRQPTQRTHNGHGFMSPDHGGRDSLPHRTLVTITGYACGCPDTTAPATPGVVLDPFGGTGTTALVASCFGRVGITVDLSADYCRLARWRTTDPGERARVLGVDKPAVQVDGQLGLFEGGAA